MSTHIVNANSKITVPYNIGELLRILNNINRLMKDRIRIEDKHMYCLSLINIIDNTREPDDILHYCCKYFTNLR